MNDYQRAEPKLGASMRPGNRVVDPATGSLQDELLRLDTVVTGLKERYETLAGAFGVLAQALERGGVLQPNSIRLLSEIAKNYAEEVQQEATAVGPTETGPRSPLPERILLMRMVTLDHGANLRRLSDQMGMLVSTLDV